MSIKFKGSDSILYNATKGTLQTSGVLAADSWFKIYSVADSGSALPALGVTAVFKSPENVGDQITLAAGDAVIPLTLTEVCKVDTELSGEMGVIDTTDSCDYPYNTSVPDGFTSLSGSINTMMRFDEVTEELEDVSQDFLVKFFDIVSDDAEGAYTLTPKDDSDLLLFILLNSKATTNGKIQNFYIVPAILNSVSSNVALKDVLKADYGWTKGQGLATFYKRAIIASA